MSTDTDVIASAAKHSRPFTGLPRRSLRSLLAMTARGVARETLPVLVILYPLLLLLDDLEPGFVRSIVNPHVFLLALVAVGMLAANEPDVSRSQRSDILLVIGAAIIGGVWVWWKLQAGILGIVVGSLTVIAIVAVMGGMGKK